ncbi:hypothetical protein PRZ48_009042 [Zasmidium cellare]|uniref:Uncharacterized protein n=1 Tax=Zasmidium cellare TaxID=395010 RepID=A0ABR0EI70_ZASCE|nr:hypothetical protein PRZ48_009042 [Zasmidium cellare]
MSGIDVAFCLRATPEQLKQLAGMRNVGKSAVQALTVFSDQKRREIEWIEALRDQKLRSGFFDKVADMPKELAVQMLDVTTENYGPIEYRDDYVDVVAIAAGGILGALDSAQNLGPLMEKALLRNNLLIAPDEYIARATRTTQDEPLPLLAKYLQRARSLVVRVLLEPGRPHKAAQRTAALIKDLTETSRQDASCPLLRSLCIQVIIPSKKHDPNAAFAGWETTFDGVSTGDTSELRPALRDIVQHLQTQTVDGFLVSTFQIRVRSYWSKSEYATWQGEKLDVKGKTVDDILKQAKDERKWIQVQ